MKMHVTAYPHWTLSNHQQTWNKILNFWMKATFLKLIHQLGSQILAVRRKYLHQNPRLHVKIVLHRSDLLFYLSHKPHVFPVRSAKLPLPPPWYSLASLAGRGEPLSTSPVLQPCSLSRRTESFPWPSSSAPCDTARDRHCHPVTRSHNTMSHSYQFISNHTAGTWQMGFWKLK